VYNFDFIRFDDGDYVVNNFHIHSGLNWENIRWAFTANYAANWHPLTWISHTIDYQLFGNWAGGYHLVNLAFHIANSILLFYCLLLMTKMKWPSALVAALFALHPLHIESVAWVSERKDLLSTLFLMLTMIAYVKWIESRKYPSLTPSDFCFEEQKSYRPGCLRSASTLRALIAPVANDTRHRTDDG
jgi:hypothetical protein